VAVSRRGILCEGLGVLLVVLAIGEAAALEPRRRTGSEYVVVHDIRLPADREAVRQRLAEHVDADEIDVEWLHVSDLAHAWSNSSVRVVGAKRENCAGPGVDAEHMMALGERAIALMGLGRRSEAQRKAEQAEAKWACLEEYVPEATLQRSALARAWVAQSLSRGRQLQLAAQQAAAISPVLPYTSTEDLPNGVRQAFVEAVDDMDGQRRWRLVVTADGAPVDAHVDGRLLERGMGAGGVAQAVTEISPGRHLLQFVRPGPVVESVVFELGSDAGEVQVEVSSAVRTTEVVQVLQRSLVRGEVVPLLGGLVAAHPVTRVFDQVVYATADHRFEQTRLVLLPTNRAGEERYETDSELYARLEATLDDESMGAEQTVIPANLRREPVGPWRFRLGVSGGPAFINGFVYGAGGVELTLETPVFISVDFRPEVAFVENSDHTFVLGGGGAYVALWPRVKRLRFGAGIGVLLRHPDHRYLGTRVHPAAEFGVGVRPAKGLWISLRSDLTLSKHHDFTFRLALEYEFELGRRRGK